MTLKIIFGTLLLSGADGKVQVNVRCGRELVIEILVLKIIHVSVVAVRKMTTCRTRLERIVRHSKTFVCPIYA